MSEPQPSVKRESDFRTIMFMVILSFICALILSVLASALAKPQEIAQTLDRSKQMMIAAKILDYNENFLIQTDKDDYTYAKYVKGGYLEPGSEKDVATQDQILEIFRKRLVPRLINDQGEIKTFEEAKVNYENYLNEYKKTGYYKQPLKLIYEIRPNAKTEDKNAKPVGYVIPVSGYGLWDAIYGYLAIKPDGNTVIGITWYDQKETPGLGANIAESYWQNLFPGKLIFQESPDGKTNFKTAPLGIVVVKGKVSEVLGDSPKAKSAVDGMAGATLTGTGVTNAYKDVLMPYRPFLIKIHEEFVKEKKA